MRDWLGSAEDEVPPALQPDALRALGEGARVLRVPFDPERPEIAQRGGAARGVRRGREAGRTGHRAKNRRRPRVVAHGRLRGHCPRRGVEWFRRRWRSRALDWCSRATRCAFDPRQTSGLALADRRPAVRSNSLRRRDAVRSRLVSIDLRGRRNPETGTTDVQPFEHVVRHIAGRSRGRRVDTGVRRRPRGAFTNLRQRISPADGVVVQASSDSEASLRRRPVMIWKRHKWIPPGSRARDDRDSVAILEPARSIAADAFA